MNQTPILFLGDSPSVQGGLSRIGRDLAILTSKMDEFRVGFLGRGGIMSRQLPFAQYNYPEYEGWGEDYLEGVWKNFAGDEPGVIMTIWDPSRLLWLHPRYAEQEWLQKQRNFQLWGYFPIDHESVGGRLSLIETEAIKVYDRVLAYGIYGSTIISNSLGWKQAADFIPHGVNMDKFAPRDYFGTRVGLGIPDTTTVLGVVMTNQLRKDWGLAFETIAILKDNIPNLKVWCKTDVITRHWDLRALSVDFGVQDVVMVDDKVYNDTELSYMYSMCDMTFLPTLGEGFGYPIVESLACDVPCVTGSYGGGAELVHDPKYLVDPAAWRYDTIYNCKRPVYDATEFASTIYERLKEPIVAEVCRKSVEHLNWSKLYTVWQRWMKEGVE